MISSNILGRGFPIHKAVIYVLLAVLSVVAIGPVLNGILISFKHPVDAFTVPPKIIFEPTLDHHRRIWVEDNFGYYVRNSFTIVTITILISVPIACLSGYAFARYSGKGALLGLILLLAIRSFPKMILIIPFFMMSRAFGVYDTILVMVMVMVAFNQPFSVWLMRGFFFDVPHELEDAAMIDGCSRFGAFARVILPAARPGVIATIIFSFLVTYNDLIFALILTGTRAKTIPVAISRYGEELIRYWSFSAAGVTAAIVPVIIIMIFLQKPLLRGFAGGVTN